MGDATGRVEVRRATDRDLDQILELARSRALTPDSRDAGDQGFLVSAFDLDDYRYRVENADYFFVAVEGDRVVGFLLGYTSDQLLPDEWLNRRVEATLGRFIVIKQVTVARDVARSGVGSQLYYEILTRSGDLPVIAAVVAEPVNRASARFHKKLGFEEMTHLTPPDGIPRSVWVFRPPPRDLFMMQYQLAVDLYKHEDSLNWSKLNNFIYVTTGLIAAASFIAQLGRDDVPLLRGGLLLLIVVGLLTSACFAVMLHFGRLYLQRRKAVVTQFEEMMAWWGGSYIVGDVAGKRHPSWLDRSPTALVMVVMPFLAFAVWLGALLVVL